MSIRLEVTEEQWLAGLRQADYVVLDLGLDQPRPWLEEAVQHAELIGRCTDPADQELLDRALELDVDFLSIAAVAENFDARRLPLRLIVEQQMGEAARSPDLFGAAWARRISAWGPEDREALEALARRERIFLGAPHTLPETDWLELVAPFALAVPADCDHADAARIRKV